MAALTVLSSIGDGALQMTLQEIGSIIRNRLPVYFFINNNNGYVA
jgi:TPP-dependent 2-oxoacid decarboxylase